MSATIACDCGPTPVRGAIWPMASDSDWRFPFVERCDNCQRFDYDEDAARAVATAVGGIVVLALIHGEPGKWQPAVYPDPRAKEGTSMRSYCQNCDWQGPDEQLGRQLADTPHLLERVDPGEPMPTGECPECGALCQPLEDDEQADTRHERPRMAENLHMEGLSDGELLDFAEQALASLHARYADDPDRLNELDDQTAEEISGEITATCDAFDEFADTLRTVLKEEGKDG